VPRHTAVERNGLVLVWYDETGRPPFFEVPELPEWEDRRYSRRWTRYQWTVKSHPQEMVENGLDWRHFPTVHRMDVPRNPRYRFEGPSYTWDIDAGKDYTLQSLREDFALGGENWGLGYSVTRQTGAFRTCIVTGMTPIDRDTVCIKLGVIARRNGESDEAMEETLQKYVEEHALVATQDFEIWEHKLYRPDPVLCEEDGPIAEYRRWIRQFYAELTPSA
jgi:3-ketosteroid 9alpha-monooxygenase subunit A